MQIQGRLSLDVSDRKRRCWGLLNVDSELREFMGQITPPHRRHPVRVRHTDLWETATERGAVRKERSGTASRAGPGPPRPGGWKLPRLTLHQQSSSNCTGWCSPKGGRAPHAPAPKAACSRVLCMCISDRDAKRGPQGTRPDGPTWVHAGLMAQDPRMKL